MSNARHPGGATTAAARASGFEARLRAGHFVLTAEVNPPVSSDRSHLLQRAIPLRDLVDAVNLTDGASAHAHMSAMTAAGILTQNGIEPILQFTCRDRNRIALQSDLLGAATLGIRNLLIVRGDDPGAGDQPQAKPVFDLDSRALIETAVALRDRHELPSGRKMEGAAGFFIGAADTPLDPPADWTPVALKSKIAAGAEFAQTQFCMDTRIVGRYMRRLADEGITERLFILIGVAPLPSAGAAHWILDHLPGSIIPDETVTRLERAADPRAEGRRICVDLLHELSDIPGVSGAHIMAPRNPDAIAEVIAAAGLGPSRHAS